MTENPMRLLALIQLSAPVVAAPVGCNAVGDAHFEREADLPLGVISALGAPMAAEGQAFQVTDFISNPGLPIYRFVQPTSGTPAKTRLPARPNVCAELPDFQ
jgi:hypothetical protein